MYIEIKGIKFKYKKNSEDIINNFALNIQKGEIISVFGESGSGKSTFLRILAGLEVPYEGLIKIDDNLILDNNTCILPEKRGIGMVFQDYALFPHMTVEKNIMFGLINLTKKEKEKRLKEILELVNLHDLKDRYPYELSGGQQQRVALARALAPRPSLLLLDEPFSNLDTDLQVKIREELKKIIKETKITSIFVTHDREDSIAIADKVVLLQKGIIKDIGKPKEILIDKAK